MTIILALAALAASFTVGMVFGVGLYRAGQVRGLQAAQQVISNAGQVIAHLESELDEAMAEIDSWMLHGGPPEHDDFGVMVDMPEKQLTDVEYERFWNQVEEGWK